MSALFHSAVSCHGQKAYLAVFAGSKDNHALAQLLFQLVAQVTETVHIHVSQFCCEKFHAFDLLYLIHNIAQSILCKLALQSLILAVECFHLALEMSNLVLQLSRSGL